MKILIIEDEPKTGNYLKQGLTEAGFMVVVATNGQDGLHLALGEIYDLAILDVMLPALNGWEVLRELRIADKNFPVLLLSALSNVDDRVKGLELGADDYLVKPFAFTELLARVRTLLRRGNVKQTFDHLQFADLELNLLRRCVVRGGKKINVTAKEFALLEFMIQRQGEVLSRTLIASQVWDINFNSDTNVIDVAIRRLRAKIDDNFDVKLIQTIRGMGYMLEAS